VTRTEGDVIENAAVFAQGNFAVGTAILPPLASGFGLTLALVIIACFVFQRQEL